MTNCYNLYGIERFFEWKFKKNFVKGDSLMNLLVNILSIVIIGILAISLIFTWSAARQHKVVEGELDTKIAKPVQEHVYMRNPIFLSYIIFFALVLFIILFVAITFY